MWWRAIGAPRPGRRRNPEIQQWPVLFAAVVHSDDVRMPQGGGQVCLAGKPGAVLRSADTSAASTLSASCRGNRGCWARYTSPMPPLPSSRTIRYPANTSPSPNGTRAVYRFERGSPRALGARCNSANPAVAIGRTPKSLVVICEDYDGRFYFKGLGLADGHSVKIENFVLVEDKFTASSSGVRCLVSPVALTITRGLATITNEPMLEYWSV